MVEWDYWYNSWAACNFRLHLMSPWNVTDLNPPSIGLTALSLDMSCSGKTGFCTSLIIGFVPQPLLHGYSDIH